MVEVVKSATFDRWLRRLKDRRAAARVLIRVNRLAAGNAGAEATISCPLKPEAFFRRGSQPSKPRPLDTSTRACCNCRACCGVGSKT